MTSADDRAPAPPPTESSAFAALDRAEQELAAGTWRLTPGGIEAAQRILCPLDALARLVPGPDDQDETQALIGEALGAVATAVLQTGGPLHQLLAEVCGALDPLVHPRPDPADPLTASSGAVRASAARRADAERVLQRLRRLLHAAVTRPAARPTSIP